MPVKDEYRSRVYTDRPPYADFDAPEKFQAIQSIIAKRLVEHPKSYLYRQKYNEYKKERMQKEAEAKTVIDGQLTF